MLLRSLINQPVFKKSDLSQNNMSTIEYKLNLNFKFFNEI